MQITELRKKEILNKCIKHIFDMEGGEAINVLIGLGFKVDEEDDDINVSYDDEEIDMLLSNTLSHIWNFEDDKALEVFAKMKIKLRELISINEDFRIWIKDGYDEKYIKEIFGLRHK